MAAEHGSSAESRWIARILRGGLLASLVLMLASLAWWFASGGHEAERLRPGDLARARGANGLALVAVLVLAVTPAVRVAGLGVLWARERDVRFVVVAVVVAVVLVVATLLGGG